MIPRRSSRHLPPLENTARQTWPRSIWTFEQLERRRRRRASTRAADAVGRCRRAPGGPGRPVAVDLGSGGGRQQPGQCSRWHLRQGAQQSAGAAEEAGAAAAHLRGHGPATAQAQACGRIARHCPNYDDGAHQHPAGSDAAAGGPRSARGRTIAEKAPPGAPLARGLPAPAAHARSRHWMVGKLHAGKSWGGGGPRHDFHRIDLKGAQSAHTASVLQDGKNRAKLARHAGPITGEQIHPEFASAGYAAGGRGPRSCATASDAAMYGRDDHAADVLQAVRISPTDFINIRRSRRGYPGASHHQDASLGWLLLRRQFGLRVERRHASRPRRSPARHARRILGERPDAAAGQDLRPQSRRRPGRQATTGNQRGPGAGLGHLQDPRAGRLLDSRLQDISAQADKPSSRVIRACCDAAGPGGVPPASTGSTGQLTEVRRSRRNS